MIPRYVQGLAAIAHLQRGGVLRRRAPSQVIVMTLRLTKWCGDDIIGENDSHYILRECFAHEWEVA